MGSTPAKVGRINDRDTQTTGPDPRSIGGLAIARSNPTRVSRWIGDQSLLTVEFEHYNIGRDTRTVWEIRVAN